MPTLSQSTSLTITNPLVLYRTLVSTKRIEPDPSQHRLAIHLQKLYQRLKDYQPDVDFSHRLRQINSFAQKPSVADGTPNEQEKNAEKSNHGIFAKWRSAHEYTKVTALTRRLTNRESAIELQSPKGLLLYGDVGTGKSLLVNLLADCLPNQRKRRWHFNTFMLETFAKLEALRKESLRLPLSTAADCEEHSLVHISRDLVAVSPLLFLDEFQMPDRVASKILSSLLTSFFHLGGVLIATSNRMPEELANAAGVEFTAPPRSPTGLRGSNWGLPGKGSLLGGTENVLSERSDFTAFLEVLKARCEVWEMEGAKDWRREETDQEALRYDRSGLNTLSRKSRGHECLEPLYPGNLGLGYEQSLQVDSAVADGSSQRATISKSRSPTHYFVRPAASANSQEAENIENEWKHREASALYLSGITDNALNNAEVSWKATSIRVYGRDLLVPRCIMGVTKWTFDDLCGRNLGPADYVSVASTFHTLILTDVPVLSFLQRNEARRLITLLDALYEAKCKLLISAQAGPDDIFFPESPPISNNVEKSDETLGPNRSAEDSVYSETFSEMYQDQTSPFRPNVSLYTSSASPPAYASNPGTTSASQLSVARSILADEDSDFGFTYGGGRWDDARNGHPTSRQAGPDFTRTGAYTGEDEKFAYKRARSRLWEMCNSRWWAREGDWWKPLDKESRRWETSSTPMAGMEPGLKKNESSFKHATSPFRTSDKPPPRFSWTHAWGMMIWGKKAGAWGKGPAGLSERKGNARSHHDESKDEGR